MKPAKRLPGAEAIMREIRIEMVRRNLSVKDLATSTGYAEGHLHNVIQGWKMSQPARAKIAAALGKNFWEANDSER